MFSLFVGRKEPIFPISFLLVFRFFSLKLKQFTTKVVNWNRIDSIWVWPSTLFFTLDCIYLFSRTRKEKLLMFFNTASYTFYLLHIFLLSLNQIKVLMLPIIMGLCVCATAEDHRNQCLNWQVVLNLWLKLLQIRFLFDSSVFKDAIRRVAKAKADQKWWLIFRLCADSAEILELITLGII